MLRTRFFSPPDQFRLHLPFRPKLELLEDRRLPGSLLIGGTASHQNYSGLDTNDFLVDLWESALIQGNPRPTHRISDLKLDPGKTSETPDPERFAIPAFRNEGSSSREKQTVTENELSCHTTGWTGVFPISMRHPAKSGFPSGKARGTVQGIGGTWYTLQPMPSMRQEIATAAFKGEIFVIGGYDQ